MKNMIKKEMILMFRSSKWILIGWCLFQVFMPLFFVKEIADLIRDQELLNHLFVGVIIFYPLMTIPIICVLIFTGSINEERRQGILKILLANGVDAKEIWRSKLFSSLLVAEIISLLTEGVSLCFIRALKGFWLDFSTKEMLFLLLFFPFLAGVLSGCLCLVLWIFKQGQLFATMIPFIIFFGCCFAQFTQTNIIEKFNGYIICGIVMGGILLLILMEMVVGLIKKEYIVNLGST